MGDFDTVVVGGGPAGASYAITCAIGGLRVAIIEKRAFPRDAPGETLHPGVEPLLRQLGVFESVLSENFLRHEGHWAELAGSRRFQPFGRDDSGVWLGFQVRRSIFDSILLERARSLGVQIFQPERALEPVLIGERVAAVLTSSGLFTSRYLIDAAGSNHWLTRRLRKRILHSSPGLFVSHGYVKCKSVPAELPIFVGGCNGWEWIAQTRTDVLQWVRLSLGKSQIAKNRPEFLRTCAPTGTGGVADVTWRYASPECKGCLALGDAAFVLDPAASHGVLKAMMSGILAATLVIDVTRGVLSEEIMNSYYNQWMMTWFQHDVRQLKEFYSQLDMHL